MLLLSKFELMIVGKYLSSIQDFKNLVQVDSMLNDLCEMYHFNPINTLNNVKEIQNTFKNINTYHVSTQYEFEHVDEIKNMFNTVVFKHVFYGLCNEDDSKILVYPNQIIKKCGEIKYKCLDKSCICEIRCPEGFTDFEIFKDCKHLEYFSLPKGLKHIDDLINFRFKHVIIPDTVTSINDFAFLKCWRLQDIVIPENVTSLGEETFCLCRSLTKVVLPKGLKYLHSTAFEDCPKLEDINIPEGCNVNIDEFNEYKCSNEGCTAEEEVNYQMMSSEDDSITYSSV